MKKVSLLMFCLMAYSLTMLAQQAPQKINYQTVVRDATGAPVINQAVSLRFSILQGSVAGSSVYSETHATTTNAFGLATVQIGGGSPISGTFATIDWGTSGKFLKIEADVTGGSTYINLSTVEMVSVPYAQYASTAATAAPTGAAGGDLTGTYPNPTLANHAVTTAKISSGAATNGQVLTADGSGNATWQTAAAGGSNTVGFSAYLDYYPAISNSMLVPFWSVASPSYNDGNFNATTGVYTVPSAGNYRISAIVNYRMVSPVPDNIGSQSSPQFELRNVATQGVLALGLMPIVDFNLTLTIGLLTIRGPLRTASIPIERTVVLAAGDQVALYYNYDGMTLPLDLYYTSFTIKKL